MTTAGAAVRTRNDVSPADVARIEAWLRAVDDRAAALAPPAFSYLVVTPLGMADRDWLWRTLTDAGVALVGRESIPSWPAVSSALYVKRMDPDALRRGVLFERAWETLFPRAIADAWAVGPGSHARLETVKHAVRAEIRHVRIDLDGSVRGAVLHPFHVADGCDARAEARRLVAARSMLSPRQVLLRSAR